MNFSAGWLIASLAVSTLGMGFFIYGKKQLRIPQLVFGILLMGYPYLVSSPLWMVSIAGALSAVLWLVTRIGL